MKKSVLIAVILLAMLLCACGSGKGEDTTAPDTVADTTVQDSKKEIVVDFSTVKVSGFIYATVGDTCEGYAEAKGAEAYQVQKTDVASLGENGELTVRSAGVTLVGYYKDGEAGAYVLCAFADGEKADRASGGSAELVEAGNTYMHTAPVGEAEYFSSNESVVDVSEAPKLSFVGSGYACITCSTASRPFTYSFIVYDREAK